MSAIEKIKAKARADVKHIVLPEGTEPPSRWVHYGMTSSDLGDTALSYQITQCAR